MPFAIIRDDITRVKADAIVNSANPRPVYGRGMDSAVYRAAGAERLLEARRKLGNIAPGEARATYGYQLKAKYIIHTVGPVWEGGDKGELDTLKACYRNSLELAHSLHCKSIAFPLISTGVYGFPKDQALLAASRTIADFLQEKDMDVQLVVFDRSSFALSQKLSSSVRAFIDERYVERKAEAEYDGREPDSFLNRERRRLERGSAAFFPSRSGTKPFSGRNDADGVREAEKYFAAGSLPEDESFSDEDASAGPDAAAPQESNAGASDNPEDEAPRDFAAAAQVHRPIPSSLLPGIESIWKKESGAQPAGAVPGKKRSLQDVMAQMSETFQERLLRLIDEKGMTDPEVYKSANIDRKLFSKIRCNAKYKPSKQTVVALAMALHLNLDETKDLLGRAEYAFSPSSKFDLIIQYCIENEIFDSYEVNLILFDYQQPLLGCS